ncbi:hypothetical protein KKB28_06165 [bacterium]|nr:hypothetical protein [bacterium]
MSFQKSIVLLLLVVAALMILTGCEGPEGPQGQPGPAPIYIVGYIESPGMRNETYRARVEIYGNPGIPTVEINSIPLIRQNPNYFSHYEFPISAGDSAKLLVTFTKLDGTLGNAWANIMMPGPFDFAIPDSSNDSIQFGDSVIVQWFSSEGADVYSFDFRSMFHYRDTSGIYQYLVYDFDTVFADTLITFPPSLLFPDTAEIDSMLYGYGNIILYAKTGPVNDYDMGNVHGDGIGFLTGMTFGGYTTVFYDVSGSPIPSTRLNEFNLIQ